ncbi:MAG: hypothetical protein V3S69_00025 [Dehalococcoidales bacterium]
MPSIQYGGEVHQFPDDWDNDKISSTLAGWRDGQGGDKSMTTVPEHTPEQQVKLNAEHIRPELADASFDLEEVVAETGKWKPLASSDELTPMSDRQEQFRGNIQQIETGGLDSEWTRTHVVDSSSTAYGSYQITGGLIQGYMRNKAKLFNDAELAAMQELHKRQRVAIKIGGKSRPLYERGGGSHAQAKRWAKEFGFDDVGTFLDSFDYKGDYGLADDVEFQYQYENFSRKMLNQHLSDAKGNALEAASVWHGGTSWKKGKHKKDTEVYRTKYTTLNESQEELKGRTSAPKAIRQNKEVKPKESGTGGLPAGIYTDEDGSKVRLHADGTIEQL